MWPTQSPRLFWRTEAENMLALNGVPPRSVVTFVSGHFSVHEFVFKIELHALVTSRARDTFPIIR